jgi:hypothetical protein
MYYKHNLVFKQGQLMLEPKVKATKINSIEIWTDVFIVYMSVYCSIHTTKFQELLKYMNSIRLGAKRCSGDVGYYMTNNIGLRKHISMLLILVALTFGSNIN